MLIAATSGAAALAGEPLLADAALTRLLDQRVSVALDGRGLSAALQRLATVQRVPLWIDRRVDSSAAVTLTVNNEPLRAVLDKLCEGHSRAYAWTTLRTVVYFGPRQSALELATLSEQARRQFTAAPAATRRRWLTPAPWDFPRLSEPRTLLDEALALADAKLDGGSALPHDLWAARSLPNVAPLDRVVLLLVGFDAQAAISPDGRTLRTQAVKRPVQLTVDYPSSDQVAGTAATLAATDDSILATRRGRRLEVRARWESHERLRQSLAGDAPAQAASPTQGDASNAAQTAQRFTLTITNKPLGPVLDQLAAQLNLTLAWDPALQPRLATLRETLVSCEVHDADVDELLRAMLAPARLAFERNEETVNIRKRD